MSAENTEKFDGTEMDSQFAWAVWFDTGRRNRECISVVGDTKEEAISNALQESDNDELDEDNVRTVDGPFQNCEPALWEFEFITEHRERVVVDSPCESYAQEAAEYEREYSGEFVQTVHTEVRRIPKEQMTTEEQEENKKLTDF